MEKEEVIDVEKSYETGTNELSIQRQIEKGKRQSIDGKVRQSVVLEMELKEELDSGEVVLEKQGVEMTVNVSEIYDGAITTLNKLIEVRSAEKIYVPVFVLECLNKERVYITGLYSDRKEAQNRLPSSQFVEKNIKFKFDKKDSNRIHYGQIESIKSYFPTKIQNLLNNDIAVFGMFFLPMIVIVLIHMMSTFLYIGLSIVYVIFILTFPEIHQRLHESANVCSSITPEELEQIVSGKKNYDVVEGTYINKNNKLVIQSENGVEWTFEKNDIGELSQKGKEVLEYVSIEGDTCVFCTTETSVTDMNTYESDCGSRKIIDTKN